MKAIVGPLLLALGAFSLGGGVLYTARHGGHAAIGNWDTTHVPPGPFPKNVTNGSRSETLSKPPTRIASLTVTSDEILTRLVSPPRLAAVSRFASDPAISTCADRVPKEAVRIRGLDPERIIALEPDLVFVARYTQESALRILESATIPVVRLRAVYDFEDVESNVRLVASAVGEEARGETLLLDLTERLRRVESLVARRPSPRVLYASGGGYTTGLHTLMNEKIRRAGGRNAAAEAGLAGDIAVSVDLLVSLDPDVVIVAKWSPDAEAAVREITGSPAFRSSRVVRDGKVYALPAGVLTSESEDAVLGVEALARVLHPEAFSS